MAYSLLTGGPYSATVSLPATDFSLRANSVVGGVWKAACEFVMRHAMYGLLGCIRVTFGCHVWSHPRTHSTHSMRAVQPLAPVVCGWAGVLHQAGVAALHRAQPWA